MTQMVAWRYGCGCVLAVVLGCNGDSSPAAKLDSGAGSRKPVADTGSTASDDPTPDASIELEGAALAQAQRCERNSDCTWLPKHCNCFFLELPDVIALNRDAAADGLALTCQQRCRTLPSPYLIPHCEQGRCEVTDLRRHAVSSCETVADCSLRVQQCCECGGDAAASAVVSLPRDSFEAYQALVCDEPNPVCDACVPMYPPTEGFGLIARQSCRENHCAAEATRVEPQ